MVKLEALRVFATVAQHGNIKDAADRLGRTPSAISMTLKQLEDEIGERLFQSDRKNSLTALGEFMLKASQVQLNGFDKSVESFRAFAQGKIGHLTLASVPSVAVNIIPGLLSGFAESHPGVEIELFDIDSTSVAGMVHSGKAELGIAGRPGKSELLSFEPIFSDSFKVVCRTDSPLSKIAGPIGWSDLENHTLIVNGASQIIKATGYRRLSGQSWLSVQNTSSLFAMIHAGLGITLLPALATKSMPGGIVARDLADTSAHREVGIIQARTISPAPASAAFIEHLNAELPAQNRELNLHRN